MRAPAGRAAARSGGPALGRASRPRLSGPRGALMLPATQRIRLPPLGDPSLSLFLELSIIAVLLALSAWFSGSETALLSLGDVDLDDMERHGSTAARQAAALARRPYRILATLLLGNMAVNIVISVRATALFVDAFGTAGLGIAIPAVTVGLLILGDIVPKSLGLRHSRRLAELAAPAVGALAWALGPVRAGLERLAHAASGPARPAPLDRDELATLVDVAREEGALSPFDARVLGGILRFTEISVGRAMTPRVDLFAIAAGAEPAEIPLAFERSGRSRLPVYDGDLDHIVGILLLKDYLTFEGDRSALGPRHLMREPYFVPETTRADRLFREFQARRIHIAVVVGEHGGVEGIVTLEDLIEELIGDFHDEADEPRVELERLREGVWRVDARIELDDLSEAIGGSLDQGEGAVTLAGLLGELLGRVPRAGDAARSGGFEFRVLKAVPTRPLVVRVARLSADAEKER
jgi:putative hemolysin